MKPPVVPRAEVRYFGPGEHCSDPRPGDLVLVRSPGWPAAVIRFGERLRCRGRDRSFARVNHAATVLGRGIVQEMAGGGGQLTALASWRQQSYAVVHVTTATDEQRRAAVAAARWYVNVPYGWPSIVSDAVYVLSGLPIALAVGQSVVCSADASSAQRCLGLIPDKPDVAVLPSDLARWYRVFLPDPRLTRGAARGR